MAEIKVNGEQLDGGYDGASRFARELASWSPPIRSADADLNPEKPYIDARARDMARNEAYVLGGVAIHRDSIVGGQYVLNAQPDFAVLGADEAWAEEFQSVVEAKFSLWAESSENWPDASRINNFTGLIRLGVGIHTFSGEVLATVEWLRSVAGRRPFNTAIQFVDLDRLSNPMDQSDTLLLRRGVERDRYGAPQAYHIRVDHPNSGYVDAERYRWRRVPVRKPWGRVQVIHIFEQNRPDQSRGVADMVAALKEMRMTRRFRDVTLQNAVLQATYAASIESDLPTETLWEQLGAVDANDETNPINKYMTQLAQYAGGSKALHIDGVKIPHLFPGTKLKLQPTGTPGGVGTTFEQSLLRYIASALGLSYEQLSRDYTNTNYSSARASMVETWKAMQAKKKMVADRLASTIYGLWLEEAIAKGEVPLPAGAGPGFFYEGLNKEAISRCEWIGASRGQIDELKETQAAVLRITNNLSTFEDEISRTGKDFRTVFRQISREKKMMEELGLSMPLPAGAQGQDDEEDDNADTQDEAAK
jgi:lambda family phage portal protein